MARRKPPQEPIRKSFLIFGGVAVGVALLAFVVMNFVLGGGGGEEDVADAPAATAPGGGAVVAPPAPTPIPTPTPEPTQRPGGRDPFEPRVGAPSEDDGGDGSDPQAIGVQGTGVSSEAPVEKVNVSVLQVRDDVADIKINETVFKGVKAGETLTPLYDLDEIDGNCVYMKQAGERFKACEGGDAVVRT